MRAKADINFEAAQSLLLFCLFSDSGFHAPLGNHLLKVDRIHLSVANIPAEGFKEGINELLAGLRFVGTWGFELVNVLLEEAKEFLDRRFGG